MEEILYLIVHAVAITLKVIMGGLFVLFILLLLFVGALFFHWIREEWRWQKEGGSPKQEISSLDI